MRITLQATSLQTYRYVNDVPLSVTIKPANNLPGSFKFQTNSRALLRILRQRTDLSELALESFQETLHLSANSCIPAVNMKEDVLSEIGYFLD